MELAPLLRELLLQFGHLANPEHPLREAGARQQALERPLELLLHFSPPFRGDLSGFDETRAITRLDTLPVTRYL